MAPDAGGLFGVGAVVSAMGSEAKSASAYPRPNSAPVDRASPIAATGSCNNTAGSGRTSSIATSPLFGRGRRIGSDGGEENSRTV
jgi:hypothetical protein